MIPSLNTFLFGPFLSFNYVLSFEPSFIPKHVIVSIWDVFSAGTAFLRFFSFNQFFWNDPASVRNILVEFGFFWPFLSFLSHMMAFVSPIFGLTTRFFGLFRP